ncbi:MAG TPA: M48 family metallopeptidase [Bacteroidota bacterium]|nr:M48 family metallopeptidase [Bacteroidota bacterium]
MSAKQPQNIYEQQVRNKRLTFVIMFVFIGFLVILGVGFDLYYIGFPTDGGFVPIGTLAAFALGLGSSFWSLRGGAKAVLSSTGAVPADESNPQQKQLMNIVEEMRIASGLPQPKVYVIPDSDPNAFATGRNPQDSYVAVTQGLLDKLNREELQGVVAHELSHIRNYDIRLMTVIAALVGAVLLLTDWSRRGMFFGGGRRRRDGKSGGQLGIILLVVWVIGIILAPIVSQLLAMAVSRKREYLADASGAELTRNPLGLASALQKIDTAAEPTGSIKRGAAHLCIADPLGKKVNTKEGFVAELFGTHPPIDKRIMALHAMAYQYHPR